MGNDVFVHRSRIEVPATALWRWHVAPGALERLTPPWERVEILDRGEGVTDGSRVVLRVRTGPTWTRWVAEHRDLLEGRQFRDVQVEGPFRRWVHTHRFEPEGEGACWLEDRVEYAPPLGQAGRWVLGGMVRRKLARLFAYRHRVTAGDVTIHHANRGRPPLRVLVSGSSGLLGSALVPFLTAGGHEVMRLRRGPPSDSSPTWDPATGRVDLAPADRIDAVVHLAAENVAARRWSPAQRERLRASRVEGTRLLVEALASLPRPPHVLVSASATGFYGNRGEEELSEESAAGDGFLADVARGWEEAAAEAERRGIRVVLPRFGMVLTPAGGALPKLLPSARTGLGGPLGGGRMWWPWVCVDDALGAILHALNTEHLRGPVNVVAPELHRQRTFAATLGRVLRRPAILPAPGWALRWALGPMATELLLASQRVLPSRLEATGFTFGYPTLEASLRHLLGRTS